MTDIECAAAMRQLFDYLDGELTEERMQAIRAHLDGCRRCHPHYDFQQVVLSALSSLREVRPAPGELRARVMEALRREGMRA